MPELPAVPDDCPHVSYEYVAGASKFHVRNWCIRCGVDMPTQEEIDNELQE